MITRLPAISSGILGKKAAFKVLILGPYRSPYARSLLDGLKACLRANGYTTASLAKDVPYRQQESGESAAQYILQWSLDTLSKWAQSALFIFPDRQTHPEIDYTGVVIEFDHMLKEAAWLLETSSVLFEEKGFEQASLMLKGRVQACGISQRFFSTGEDLCDGAIAELVSHLRSSY